ncbi:hypothetical protein BDZ89DRAFT_1072410, partial [Hymenopellis radicata]
MKTRAEKAVGEWMKKLADPETYEEAKPGEKPRTPFVWYQKAKEDKKEGRVEQSTEAEKEKTSTENENQNAAGLLEAKKKKKPFASGGTKPPPIISLVLAALGEAHAPVLGLEIWRY